MAGDWGSSHLPLSSLPLALHFSPGDAGLADIQSVIWYVSVYMCTFSSDC